MIGKRTEEGLEASRVLVLCMSRHAFASEWATLESGTFRFRDSTNKGRRFIPLRLDDTEINDALKQFAYVDWQNESQSEWKRLLDACRISFNEIRREAEQFKQSIQSKALTVGSPYKVDSVAVSDDGRRAVSGAHDGKVRVWKLETGELEMTLEGHSKIVSSVAISGDGKLAVSGSRDRTVRVWDLSTGKPLHIWKEHAGRVTSVAISWDARRFTPTSMFTHPRARRRKLDCFQLPPSPPSFARNRRRRFRAKEGALRSLAAAISSENRNRHWVFIRLLLALNTRETYAAERLEKAKSSMFKTVVEATVRGGQQTIIRGAALLALTVIAYLPAMQGGFIWDDDAYVTQNRLLTAVDGWKRIWYSAHHESQYFPLVYTTLRFEHKLWGLNPVGYHVVNVLLHGMNALLVWAVLRRLALPGAWLAAAIWAVHPVNVESAAWITELKNTQSTLFYLLALLAWMKFTEREVVGSWRFYALALLLHALALFSKTSACTLPAAMALVLWVRDQPIGWRRIAQLVPFLVLGVAMGLVSMWWETHLSGYNKQFASSFGGLHRLIIATHALWFYTAKLVWPAHLTFSYARWGINPRDPLQYLWLIGCLAVAVLLWRRRKTLGRAFIAAVVFFVAALSPLLGFIPLYTFRYAFVADHYQYVASIGLMALFAGVLASWAMTWQVSRHLQYALSLALLFMLGILTWRQAGIYRDPVTLWRDTLAKNPQSWMAYNNLGIELLKAGDVEGAIAAYQASFRIEPTNVEAYSNLGMALASQGRFAEANAAYQTALRIDPNAAGIHDSYGNALANQGRVAEALVEYKAALRIKPDFAQAYYDMANTLAGQGSMAEAIAAYQAALRIAPNVAEIRNNLGSILASQGRFAEATAEFQAALRVNPDLAVVRDNLGKVLADQGRIAEAIVVYRETLRLKPDWQPTLSKLAWILATGRNASLRDGTEAAQLAERLCLLTGYEQADALMVLGAAYAELGRFAPAAHCAQRALELATANGQHELTARIEGQLKLYQDGRPYREGSIPLPFPE